MREIQLVLIKLIQIGLAAMLVPIIAIFIIAAYSQRVRRIMLYTLIPLAVLSVVAYFILAPQRLTTPDDWSQVGAALKNGALASLPFLAILGVLGITAFLFRQDARAWVEHRLHRYARQEYLLAMQGWIEPQVAGRVELEGRDLRVIRQRVKHLRITGGLGSGKSTFLRGLLREAIRQALADPTQPLPVWLDLDERLAATEGLKFARLEAVLPVKTRFLGWLLRREGQAQRLIFLVDGSVQNYGLTFASTRGGAVRPPANAASAVAAVDANAAGSAAGDLAKLMEIFNPCPFILAMPPGVENGALGHLVTEEPPLPPLSDDGLWNGCRELNKAQAKPLSAALLADSGIWRGLARRPAFLSWLAKFYAKTNRLPKDIRELFQQTLYPTGLSAEQTETALAQLAEQVAQSGEYWETLEALKPRAASRKAQGKAAAAGKIASELAASGLLKLLDRETGNGQVETRVAFAHPIFLAYATALAWQTSQVVLPAPGQAGSGTTAGSSQADLLQNDPVLAETLVIFNNIEADPQRAAATLEALISPSGPSDASAPFKLYLAAQCLLAMPAAKRPALLVERAAVRLLEQAAYDREAAGQAEHLLEPLSEAAQLSVYGQVLGQMDGTRLEQTLRRLESKGSEQDNDGQFAALTSAAHRVDPLHLLLWQGNPELSKRVGEAWAAIEPREAFELFQELFEHGPAERRAQALDLLGCLPHEATTDYLHGLLHSEKDPALRIATLRSLNACGADLVFTLLEITTDRGEDDAVRVFAAELLARSTSPEMHTSGMVREIVRASRIPMPERALSAVQKLLERLRGQVPDDLSHWEEVVNPYVVGRPVTDPGQFFGRAQLLRDLCTAVDNSTPVLITAERGGGKSSLLHRLAWILRDEASRGVPVRVVTLDMQGLQPHEFYETAIRCIIEGLHDPALFADPNVPRPYADQHFARDLGELLKHLQLKLGPNMRLAVLIDEADGFLSYPPAMHNGLRRIFSGAATQGMIPILAGRDLLRRWQQPDPPFYSAFAHLSLPRLTREETLQLVTKPVQGTFQYPPEAVERIYQAAQGRPDETQALCHKLISRLLETGERIVTAEMVAEAQHGASPRAELVSQAESLLGGMMDWIEAHPEAPLAKVEEQMKQAWTELQKAMLQQVARARNVRTRNARTR